MGYLSDTVAAVDDLTAKGVVFIGFADFEPAALPSIEKCYIACEYKLIPTFSTIVWRTRPRW